MKSSQDMIRMQHGYFMYMQCLEDEVLQYIKENSTKMEYAEDITNLIKQHKALSDAEVDASVLPFKDKELNSRIKFWVLQHKADDVDIQMIIDIAEFYDHSDFVL